MVPDEVAHETRADASLGQIQIRHMTQHLPAQRILPDEARNRRGIVSRHASTLAGIVPPSNPRDGPSPHRGFAPCPCPSPRYPPPPQQGGDHAGIRTIAGRHAQRGYPVPDRARALPGRHPARGHAERGLPARAGRAWPDHRRWTPPRPASMPGVVGIWTWDDLEAAGVTARSGRSRRRTRAASAAPPRTARRWRARSCATWASRSR
jgi:hypothetical protein